MDSNSRHQILKRLQTGLARGAPFDLSTLERIGVSAPLAARYAESGWLVRLAQGVYAFPKDDFGVYGALMFLQQRVPGLHVGGKSALALQGVRHNLGGRDPLVLWGDMRFTLPDWFTVRLFLTWARESGLLDVDDLRARYRLRTGSDKRWMSRMPDGTLLTLKPHG